MGGEMQVKILTSVVTQTRAYRRGQVVDLPPDVAAEWAAHGIVEMVEQPAVSTPKANKKRRQT